MNTPVQVLNPFRIDISIEDDPVSLGTFPTNIVDDLSENVGEKTIVPLASCRIECPIQGILVNRFGVDNVGDALSAIQPLKCRQQDFPCIGLSATRRTHHHKTMLNLLDLVELENLRDPSFASNEILLGTDLEDLFAKGVKVDREVVDTRENIGEEAEEAFRNSLPVVVESYLVRSGTSSATSLGTIVSVTLWMRMICSEMLSDNPDTPSSSALPAERRRSRFKIPALARTALRARSPKS